MNVFSYIENACGSRPWGKIILHHSSVDGQTVEEVKRYHVQTNGWADIGYHFCLNSEGGRLQYFIGRPLSMIGAHTIGQNAAAIGICLLGNYDIKEPSHEQYFMLASLCRALMRKFNIPISEIHRHSEYAQKSCPGSRFSLSRLIEYIEGIVIA